MDEKRRCPDCGCKEWEDLKNSEGEVLHTHCVDCGYRLYEEEPPEDGEAFRGGEAAAYQAFQQDWIQRNLK